MRWCSCGTIRRRDYQMDNQSEKPVHFWIESFNCMGVLFREQAGVAGRTEVACVRVWEEEPRRQTGLSTKPLWPAGLCFNERQNPRRLASTCPFPLVSAGGLRQAANATSLCPVWESPQSLAPLMHPDNFYESACFCGAIGQNATRSPRGKLYSPPLWLLTTARFA